MKLGGAQRAQRGALVEDATLACAGCGGGGRKCHLQVRHCTSQLRHWTICKRLALAQGTVVSAKHQAVWDSPTPTLAVLPPRQPRSWARALT